MRRGRTQPGNNVSLADRIPLCQPSHSALPVGSGTGAVFRRSSLAVCSLFPLGVPQQGPFAPQTLLCLSATADPSVTLSPFPDLPVSPVIRFPAPPISRRGEEGFSSCSAHPCHRAVATTPPECPAASVRLRRSMLPSLHDRELGLWGQ
jgi:hypothetical protein